LPKVEKSPRKHKKPYSLSGKFNLKKELSSILLGHINKEEEKREFNAWREQIVSKV